MPVSKPGTAISSQRIAALRNAAGLTQEDLAREVGTTRRSIGYYESESEYPPAHILAALSKTFNVSVDYLLGLSDNPKAPKASPFKEPAQQPSRLERRMKQIEALPATARRQVVQFIDTVLEANQLKTAKGKHATAA